MVLGQGFQLIGLCHAILVEVLPDADIPELGILSIEYAITITVKVAQRIETVTGLLAVGLDGIHTEQLGAIVDGAVAVAINYQEAVVALDPASASFQAVAIEVEGNPCIGGNGLDTVAIEVEGEGVTALDES